MSKYHKTWHRLWRYIDYLLIWIITGLSILLISTYVERHKQEDGEQTQPASVQLLEQGGSFCDDLFVIDGDTILATCAQQRLSVRLQGIDAPEMGQIPYGERAKRALRARLPSSIYIEFHGLDYYQRTLGVLFANDSNINLQMVRSGAAVAYDHPSTDAQYVEAEQAAKSEALGVWAQAGFQQNPKLWRRYH